MNTELTSRLNSFADRLKDNSLRLLHNPYLYEADYDLILEAISEIKRYSKLQRGDITFNVIKPVAYRWYERGHEFNGYEGGWFFAENPPKRGHHIIGGIDPLFLSALFIKTVNESSVTS